ncbi:MAG: alpha/beta hydrolase [Pseudolysinimonas sp.]|uniref:alpha/beta fold hydrolase n=1 Tax=Pseudolysinimonas sp. TaxID=2680009 RepID=UPI0032664C92
MTAVPTTHHLSTSRGEVELSTLENGSGRPVLLLHGGAGPQSVAVFADLLAESRGVRVITPTHPGFGGTPRPDGIADIPALAEVYVTLLDELGLDDVTVIGNSVGGWIASEIALRHSPRVSRMVLVDATGPVVDGYPGIDFFSIPIPQIADYSFFAPDNFRIDPSTLSPAAQAGFAANRATLAVYGGPTMDDPTLLGRLGEIDVPTLVIWGEADRIVEPGYGRAYAAAIPGARFELLSGTGHVPQVETPELLLAAVAVVMS